MSDTKTSSAASGGIGFTGLLAIAFIVLKLCHVIAWPWLWVLAPIWIPVGVGLTALLGALFFLFIVIAVKPRKGNRL